jgi:hypothetical protein
LDVNSMRVPTFPVCPYLSSLTCYTHVLSDIADYIHNHKNLLSLDLQGMWIADRRDNFFIATSYAHCLISFIVLHPCTISNSGRSFCAQIRKRLRFQVSRFFFVSIAPRHTLTRLCN